MGLLTTLALIGGAYGDYKSAKSADKANDQNADIAERNLEAQIASNEATLAEARRQHDAELEEDRALRELQLEMFNTQRNDALAEQLYNRYVQARAYTESLRAEQEAKLGATDAAGNRISFVPGRGWVTELTPTQRALQVDSEQEQQRQLRTGADRSEQIESRAVEQRGDEAQFASEAERAFRAARRPEQSALQQLLLARGAEQRNRGNDQIANAVARQGIRAGGGTNAAMMMQMARGATDQTSARQAGIDAELSAMDIASDRFSRAREEPSKLYDYFRRMSTSGAAPPAPFTPSTPNAPGSAVQTGGTGTGGIPSAALTPPSLQPITSSGTALQAMFGALGNAPQQSFVSPNTAWSDFMGNTSNTLLNWSLYNENMRKRDEEDDRFGGNPGNAGTGL